MKIGLINAEKPAPKSIPGRTAMLKGVGIGLAAAVILVAAVSPAIKNKECENNEK